MKRLSYQKLLRSKYIASKGIAYDLFHSRSERDPKWKWMPVRRLPIKAVKIDRRRLQYQGDISRANIDHIFRYFYQEAWEPIEITEGNFLLNGLVQLTVAERIGLKYIDAVRRLLKTPREKAELKRKQRQDRIMKRLDNLIFGRKLGTRLSAAN